MSRPLTRHSRPSPNFSPINTLDKPATNRNIQYSRKFAQDTPTPAESRSQFIRGACHPQFSPHTTKSWANVKRISHFAEPLAKKRKVGRTGNQRAYSQSNEISVESEDELQISHGPISKSGSNNRTTALDGRESSYRDLEARMQCSIPRERLNDNPDVTSKSRVSAREDELQDNFSVTETSHAGKEIMVPRSFRSDSEDADNASPNSSSHVGISSSRVVVIPESTKNRILPPHTDKQRAKPRSETNRLTGSEQETISGLSHAASQSSIRVPDSQSPPPRGDHQLTHRKTSEAKEYRNSNRIIEDNLLRNRLSGKTSQGVLRPQDEGNLVDSQKSEQTHGPGLGNFRGRKTDRNPVFASDEVALEAFYKTGIDYEIPLKFCQPTGWFKIKAGETAEEMNFEILDFSSICYDKTAEDGRYVRFKGREQDAFMVFTSREDREKCLSKIRSFTNSLNPRNRPKEILMNEPQIKEEYKRRYEAGDTNLRSVRTSSRCSSIKSNGLPEFASQHSEQRVAHQEPRRKLYPYTVQLFEETEKKWSRPLEFPKSNPSRATVDFDEIKYLGPEEWLNDSLVWFGIKYYFEKSPELKERIYYFNTYFYQTLTNIPPKDPSKRHINYEAVKRWTQKAGVNLFEFDHIVVPINHDAHWFLAIIANVKNIRMEPVSISDSNSHSTSGVSDGQKIIEEAVPKLSLRSPSPNNAKDQFERSSSSGARSSSSRADPSEPVVITLDSMGSAHPAVIRNLKLYLAAEADARHGMEISPLRNGINAKRIPLQDNGCDCGLFLIEFVKRFVEDPDGLVRNVVTGQMSPEFWLDTDAKKLRAKFKELVLREGYNQNGTYIPSESDEDDASSAKNDIGFSKVKVERLDASPRSPRANVESNDENAGRLRAPDQSLRESCAIGDPGIKRFRSGSSGTGVNELERPPTRGKTKQTAAAYRGKEL